MSDEPIEAARIDGAGWWQRLRFVILPELRGTIEFYVVVAAITMLAWVFAYVYTITSGGPGTSSTVLELYIYNQGLRNSLPGMASAVAVILFGGDAVFVVASGPCAARSRAETREHEALARCRRHGLAAARLRQLLLIAAALVDALPRLLHGRDGVQDAGPVPGQPPTACRGRSPSATSATAVRGGEFFTWFKNSVILTIGVAS